MSDSRSGPSTKKAAKELGSRTTVNIEISGKTALVAFEADRFLSRLRGLHAFWPLESNEALIIRPCNAIHTLTMPCAIDVVFIDSQGVVLKAETVPRHRFKRCAGASAVIEMCEGTILQLGIVAGGVLTRHQGRWV